MALQYAWKLIFLCIVLILIFYYIHKFLAIFPLIFLIFVIYFFRDPKREIPINEKGVIVSPADGKVLKIEKKDKMWRIVIFLSLFDVHRIRMPFKGKIKKIEEVGSSFFPAYQEKAFSNKGKKIYVETDKEDYFFYLLTGIIARRVKVEIKEGDFVNTGEKIGFIYFGSRVELFLPENVQIYLKVGQKVRGGETIVGKWS